MKKTLLFTCLLAACRTTSPTPPPDSVKPSAGELPTQWLVWTMSDDGLTTHRIEADGEAGVRILGQSSGAWIGVADGTQAKIWEFDRELVEAEQSDCDCEMQAMNAGEEPNCLEPVELEIGVLRAFPTGPVIKLPPDDLYDTETRQLFANINGSAGPYAFATVCIDQYACGAAHGDSLCAEHIIDLRSGAHVDEYDMAAAPLKGDEMLQFVREAYEDEHEAAEIASEDVAFTWTAPRYEQSFVPRMEEQYTGPACYACSDGLWDSYTISSRRTVDRLPGPVSAWLEAASKPPDVFAQSLDEPIGGWSVVPADAALRGHLDAVFQ